MRSTREHRTWRPSTATTPMLLAAGALLLQACASGGTEPPPTECPQPRFTGQAPEPIRSRENPLTPSGEVLAAGRSLYEGGAEPACTLCHGPSGDGRGPLATQFDPRPRNFACAQTVRGIPDGQLFWIVRNGSPGTAMPAFEDELSEEQTWQLVAYLRALAAR
jgi:mono/diheme cytochrome c family protein